MPTSSDKAHGKGRGFGEDYWADLICSAIGDGLLQFNFTTIHATGLYSPQIAATLAITESGMQVANQAQEWKVKSTTISTNEIAHKKKRTAGGSNLMPVIEHLLASRSNWYEIDSTPQYQYPGVFPPEKPDSPELKRMGHIVDCSKLPQFTEGNPHLLYNENQLSKGHYNDNVREVVVDGNKQNVHIRYAACQGVLKCDTPNCTFASSKKAKKCPTHPMSQLTSSGKCPVYVVYVYPTNYQENHERWFTGITKDQVYNLSQSNLHNHALPKPSKVPMVVKTAVKEAVQCNPALTPSQVNLGMFK